MGWVWVWVMCSIFGFAIGRALYHIRSKRRQRKRLLSGLEQDAWNPIEVQQNLELLEQRFLEQQKLLERRLERRRMLEQSPSHERLPPEERAELIRKLEKIIDDSRDV